MSDAREFIKILLVEDNPDDIEITKRAFKKSGVVNKLRVVRDGEEALDFLYRKGKYQDLAANSKPGLVLLDINLPKLKGIEVLKKIKEDPDFKIIPTVVLTVSRRDEDIVRSYDYGCNSFIQKPVKFEAFVEVIRQIGLYWGLLNVNSLNTDDRR